MPPGASHAVTMTGELSDVFADRAEGVAYLVAMMRKATARTRLSMAAMRAFLMRTGPGAHPRRGLGQLACERCARCQALSRRGLFVDAGTTTTDLIPLRAGAPPRGAMPTPSGSPRASSSMPGVVRTPVMAMAQTAVQGPHAADRG